MLVGSCGGKSCLSARKSGTYHSARKGTGGNPPRDEELGAGREERDGRGLEGSRGATF